MSPAQFRRIALSFPDAVENAHMGRPDFRVRKKIFATLGSGSPTRCVLKFTLEQQEMFMRVDASAFAPVDGGWGRKGWTYLHLATANETVVRDALALAWRNIAPNILVAAFDAAALVR